MSGSPKGINRPLGMLAQRHELPFTLVMAAPRPEASAPVMITQRPVATSPVPKNAPGSGFGCSAWHVRPVSPLRNTSPVRAPIQIVLGLLAAGVILLGAIPGWLLSLLRQALSVG